MPEAEEIEKRIRAGDKLHYRYENDSEEITGKQARWSLQNRGLQGLPETGFIGGVAVWYLGDLRIGSSEDAVLPVKKKAEELGVRHILMKDVERLARQRAGKRVEIKIEIWAIQSRTRRHVCWNQTGPAGQIITAAREWAADAMPAPRGFVCFACRLDGGKIEYIRGLGLSVETAELREMLRNVQPWHFSTKAEAAPEIPGVIADSVAKVQ